MRLLPLGLLAFAALLVGCTQIDCPLNNRVYANFRFYNYLGDSVMLNDTLSITTRSVDMEDSVHINKQVGTVSFSLPVSYGQREDEYYLTISGANYEIRDTIRITKESRPHFESVDCNPSFFHTVTDAMCTHNILDSVVINNKTINYDSSKEHFKVYVFTDY